VKTERNVKRGTAKVILTVPGPGRLLLRGKGLKKVRKTARQARVSLAARPKGALERKLAVAGKAKAKVRITFRPKLSADSKTKTTKLSFRKRV
jgi:hypothetical protein